MVKTRFAPSPTGFLHVGGLRTALFSYLFAKKNNGVFFLRIEDTDRERYVEGGVDNFLNSLYWIGVVPDEGVKLNENKNIIQIGENGPYIQSERLEIYKKYAHELLEKGQAYYCFCDSERLEKLREERQAQNLPTGYDGKCRNLSKVEVEEKLAKIEKYVIRMKMPQEGVTKFVDLIRGEIEFKNELVDDQVLIKSDGFPTYHMAAVVDDHLMGTTHVIRGDEWVSSTPKHIVLYDMFGWEKPQFAHLSLLVNEQKKKLSKRHGDVSVSDFREAGYLSEALVNFIVFLGWNPGSDREIFSLEELQNEFDISNISKSPAVFNREKLDWYNREYLKSMDPDKLLNVALPFLINANLVHEENINRDWLKNVIALEKDRVNTLVELANELSFMFAETLEYDSEMLVWKKSTKEETKGKLLKLFDFLNSFGEEVWIKENLEEETKKWIEENNFGNGDVLWPMRVALSGQKNSPGPFEIAAVLGKEKTLERLKNGLEKL